MKKSIKGGWNGWPWHCLRTLLGNENADIGAKRLVDGNDDDRVAVAGVLGHGVLGAVDRVNAKGGLRLNAQLEEAIGKVLAPAKDHLKADPVDAGSGAVDVAHAQPINCREREREREREHFIN